MLAMSWILLDFHELCWIFARLSWFLLILQQLEYRDLLDFPTATGGEATHVGIYRFELLFDTNAFVAYVVCNESHKSWPSAS